MHAYAARPSPHDDDDDGDAYACGASFRSHSLRYWQEECQPNDRRTHLRVAPAHCHFSVNHRKTIGSTVIFTHHLLGQAFIRVIDKWLAIKRKVAARKVVIAVDGDESNVPILPGLSERLNAKDVRIIFLNAVDQVLSIAEHQVVGVVAREQLEPEGFIEVLFILKQLTHRDLLKAGQSDCKGRPREKVKNHYGGCILYLFSGTMVVRLYLMRAMDMRFEVY